MEKKQNCLVNTALSALIMLCNENGTAIKNFSSSNLDVHLDDGFSDQRCTEECTKGNKKVATCDSSEIKQRVWNLKQSKQIT